MPPRTRSSSPEKATVRKRGRPVKALDMSDDGHLAPTTARSVSAIARRTRSSVARMPEVQQDPDIVLRRSPRRSGVASDRSPGDVQDSSNVQTIQEDLDFAVILEEKEDDDDDGSESDGAGTAYTEHRILPAGDDASSIHPLVQQDDDAASESSIGQDSNMSSFATGPLQYPAYGMQSPSYARWGPRYGLQSPSLNSASPTFGLHSRSPLAVSTDRQLAAHFRRSASLHVDEDEEDEVTANRRSPEPQSAIFPRERFVHVGQGALRHNWVSNSGDSPSRSASTTSAATGHGKEDFDFPGPTSDSDAEAEQESSGERRTFADIFWGQFVKGVGFFGTTKACVSLVFAVILLVSVICSAGPICTHHNFAKLLWIYVKQSPKESFCEIAIFTLLGAGVGDCVVALAKTCKRIGVRQAHQSQLLLDNQKETFNRSARILRAFVAPILVDLVDRVLEPTLMLVLTLALRDSWMDLRMRRWNPSASNVEVAFFVALNLHVLKWVCQACEIYFGLRGRLKGFKWVQKPIVFLFLVLLCLAVIYLNREVFVFSLTEDVQAAGAYWRSDHARTGNETTLSIASWAAQRTTRALNGAYQVTQALVTPSSWTGS